MKKIFLILSFLWLLASCSSSLFPGGSKITERFPGIPDDIFYQTVGTCEDGDLSFRILIGGGAILWDVPNTQSEADVLTGQFEIFLNRDQTYTLKYREFSFTNEVFNQTFTSQYSFDSFSREIIFNQLGVGAIYKRAARYYLKLTPSRDFNSSLLAGQTVDIWLMNSSQGLNTDRVQYCNL